MFLIVNSNGFCCADNEASGLLIANASEAAASRLPTRVEDKGNCGGVGVVKLQLQLTLNTHERGQVRARRVTTQQPSIAAACKCINSATECVSSSANLAACISGSCVP